MVGDGLAPDKANTPRLPRAVAGVARTVHGATAPGANSLTARVEAAGWQP